MNYKIIENIEISNSKKEYIVSEDVYMILKNIEKRQLEYIKQSNIPSREQVYKEYKENLEIQWKTIENRLHKGYSPEESILPYIKFNKNLQIDNHLKIINQTNNKSNYNVLINNKPEIWSIIMINKYLEKNNITL